jgi:hypothetical protein
MNKMKTLLIVALAAIIAIGGVGIGIGIFVNRPQIVMQTTVQNLIQDAFARDEFGVVTELLETGSFEVIMSAEGDGNEVSFEYKEYFGLKKYQTYIEKVKLSANDFSVEGSAYVGEDYMYVSAPLLYNSPIGIARGKTAEEFADSLFAFESGSEYEFDQELSDAITVFCRIYDDAKDKEAVEDIKELLESYVRILMDSISKHADIEKENDSIKIHGDRVNARVITVEVDAECAYNVLCDLYDELKDDNRIPKLIKKYGKLADKYVEGTSLEGVIQTNLGEDEDDDLTDILLEAYDDILDDMDSMIDDAEDALDDGGSKIVIEMATKKSSSTLVALNVAVKDGGEKMEVLDVQLGKGGIKNTEKITVEVMQEFVAEFAVKQDDKDGYKCEFTLAEGDEEVGILFAKIDRAGGKFSLGATVEGESYEITGKYDKSGKKHTFELKDAVYTDSHGVQTSLVDELASMALDIDLEVEIKVIICEKDSPKPLAKSKLKSAFTLDEEDFDDIKIAVEELMAEAQNAFNDAGSGSEAIPEETAAAQ